MENSRPLAVSQLDGVIGPVREWKLVPHYWHTAGVEKTGMARRESVQALLLAVEPHTTFKGQEETRHLPRRLRPQLYSTAVNTPMMWVIIHVPVNVNGGFNDRVDQPSQTKVAIFRFLEFTHK